MRAADKRRKQLGEQVSQIVDAWNGSLPRNHVRFVNSDRRRELELLLREFDAETICEAIRFYGRQDWQKRKNAWQRFDNWISLRNVTLWIEDMYEDEDRRRRLAEQKQASSSPAAVLTAQIGQKVPKRLESATARFNKLPAAERKPYLDRAARELKAAGVHPSKCKGFTLTMHAALTWQQEEQKT